MPWSQPEPAHVDEIAPALRILFRHFAPLEAERRIENALLLSQMGQLSTDGLFVVRDNAGLVGAVFCMPMAGASGMLWPPQVLDRALQPTVEDLLLSHAVSWLGNRGIKLVQVLLSPEESREAAALERHRFRHITHLWHLIHDLKGALPHLRQPRLLYDAFDPAQPSVFEQTLLRTYEGTLDCPEVAGVRTVSEVLDCHRAQGVFDPDRWWLLRENGDPVGVVVIMEQPENRDWEIVYFGIVPEARRRGLGREAMIRVLHQARQLGRSRVELSVDGRNTPARALIVRSVLSRSYSARSTWRFCEESHVQPSIRVHSQFSYNLKQIEPIGSNRRLHRANFFPFSFLSDLGDALEKRRRHVVVERPAARSSQNSA